MLYDCVLSARCAGRIVASTRTTDSSSAKLHDLWITNTKQGVFVLFELKHRGQMGLLGSWIFFGMTK